MLARRIGAVASFVLFIGLVGNNEAKAAILYGDFDDIPPGAVMYLDVTESSATDTLPPALFGPPSVSANTLDFDPEGFGAYSTNGINDITDGQLNFDIMTLPGAGLTSLSFRESGDFTLDGTGTSITEIGAGIAVMVEILAVDGLMLDTPIQVIGSTSFSANLESSPGTSQPWGNVLFVDFGPALMNNQIEVIDGVTKAKVVLDDTLYAISESSSVALVAKKDFQIIPNGSLDPTVPEPSTLGLMSLAVVGVMLRRRRTA